MAHETMQQPEREYFAIVEDSDLTVCGVEFEDVVGDEGGDDDDKDPPTKKIYEFKVKRKVLAAASAPLRRMLNPTGGWKEGGENTIYLKGDSGPALNVVFKLLHGQDASDTVAETDIRGVWEIRIVAHKYLIDVDTPMFKTWFRSWYEKSGPKADKASFDDYRMLLLPCHDFDHPRAFAAVTKYLTYNAVGHITEKRPDGVKVEHLHLRPSIIQQINAAKGRLKTILHQGLYEPIKGLLCNCNCSCRKAALYDYEKALFNTRAWPLETAYLHQSMLEILSNLEGFSGGPTSKTTCYSCRISCTATTTVSNAVVRTRNYFNGLCLDCMDSSDSKSKFGDTDADYWNHARNFKWDSKCRISHDQPTWYFSFMGRREKMAQWRKDKAEERQRRRNLSDEDD